MFAFAGQEAITMGREEMLKRAEDLLDEGPGDQIVSNVQLLMPGAP